MSPIKKIITIFSLALIGVTIISSPVSAYWQCGEDVKFCRIIPFEFRKGITPACFYEPKNIDMIIGWCDFLQIISNIIGIAYALVIPLITIMIIVGGLYLITAGGNEGQIKKGKGFFRSAIIGLIIVMGAGIIVGLIIRGLGVTEGTTLMPWFF